MSIVSWNSIVNPYSLRRLKSVAGNRIYGLSVIPVFFCGSIIILHPIVYLNDYFLFNARYKTNTPHPKRNRKKKKQ